MAYEKSGPWAILIKQEIIAIKLRLAAIESRLAMLIGGVVPPAVAKEEAAIFTEMGAGYVGYEPLPPREEGTEYDPVKTLVLVAAARRALYGYGQLLNEFGLDKDQKKALRQLEETMGVILRLTQAINLLMMATKMMEVSSPWAIPYLALSGGMVAASMGYGAKLSSGG